MSAGLLTSPPSDDDLARLYFELAAVGAPCVGRNVPWSYRVEHHEMLLALAGEALRYDARLLSILLQHVLAHWSDINPLRLRFELAKSRWPQALLVVFEFARAAERNLEIGWMADYVGAGFERVSPEETFFIGVVQPGGRISSRRQGRNLAAYARFGFIGSERPIADLTTRRTVGRYDAATRRRILDALLSERDELTLSDYLAAVDFGISRQQALQDLRRAKEIVRTGHGRGARWKRRRDE